MVGAPQLQQQVNSSLLPQAAPIPLAATVLMQGPAGAFSGVRAHRASSVLLLLLLAAAEPQVEQLKLLLVQVYLGHPSQQGAFSVQLAAPAAKAPPLVALLALLLLHLQQREQQAQGQPLHQEPVGAPFLVPLPLG